MRCALLQPRLLRWPAWNCVCCCSALWQSIWRSTPPTPTWRAARRLLSRHKTHVWTHTTDSQNKTPPAAWRPMPRTRSRRGHKLSKICQCWKLIMFFIHHLALLQHTTKRTTTTTRRRCVTTALSLDFSRYLSLSKRSLTRLYTCICVLNMVVFHLSFCTCSTRGWIGGFFVFSLTTCTR